MACYFYILLIVLLVVDVGTDAITNKPYFLLSLLPTENEFVANFMCDNLGIILFDLRGCGGC